MNKIDLTDERYLVANIDSKETLEKEYWDIIFEGNKNNVDADTKKLDWVAFRMKHLGEKCVWDKETGNMFTVE